MATEHMGYRISEDGIVLSPGKFEGERWYAIDAYEWMLDGMDELIGDTSVFPLDDSDRSTFGLDPIVYALTLDVDDYGFVHVGTLTRNAYERDRIMWESAEDSDDPFC